MSGANTTFIVVAYGITFLTVGAMVATIVLRHRALKQALARIGDASRSGR